ncbi:MAG: hypothetical protein [Inoviridae sp.]|nr:MAG: hypothetical protein [Inoviridae sp.]
MKRALKMTIQLELDFLPAYAFESASELRTFAFSIFGCSHNFTSLNFPHYKKLQRQATDLKNYAFLNGYIDDVEYTHLSNLIIESSDIFWG